MNRRDFMALTAAVTLATPMAAKADAISYTPGLVQKHLAAGDVVFLDFKASWCSTCKAQERVINALKSENPDYEKAVTFINVDWDDYKNADITVNMNIPRRSTLVVLKGQQELGRIVAGTGRGQIKKLMDTALAAAASS